MQLSCAAQCSHTQADTERDAGCHGPHGADSADLLTKFYSTRFYQHFESDRYELCFSCHDKKLVETKEAEGLTGFRNGTQNLHFVHVDEANRIVELGGDPAAPSPGVQGQRRGDVVER